MFVLYVKAHKFFAKALHNFAPYYVNCMRENSIAKQCERGESFQSSSTVLHYWKTGSGSTLKIPIQASDQFSENHDTYFPISKANLKVW